MILKNNEWVIILLVYVTSIFLTANATLEKSPKIITNEGNVILEAGINKNITISLKGRSRLIVNDLDLMGLLVGDKFWLANSSSDAFNGGGGIGLRILQEDVESLKNKLLGRNGLTARLGLLLNRTTVSNPVNLLRRTQRRLTSLQVKVQSIITRLARDSCASNPCDNGGTCIHLFDDFLCKCNKGFEGKTCSTDVNECALFVGTDLGCQNGAQCINQFGSYSCICASGWQGMHCSQRKTDCLHSSNTELCGHGICVNINDNFGYRCMCEQGWTTNDLTPACSVDVDECKQYSSPCSTKCINLPGSYMCAPCEAGYTGNGLSCRDIDECATDNGGCSVSPFVPCINSYGSFHCGECPIGWSGDGRICTRTVGASCTRNNICHPSAMCSEVGNSVVCSCPLGQIGNGVGPNGCRASGTSSCLSNPCLNGGTCMDTGDGTFICVCPHGFRAPNCQRIPNPCVTNPCRNGGTCRPNGSNFTCDCVQGYGGRLCATQRSRCGQYIRADQGNLKYPLTDLYNHNTKCSWVIRTNATKVLNITFIKFDIEDSADCRFDWLQIHDGPTVASQLIGRFCGTTAPMGGNIITTMNSIHLWFKSDNTTAKAGFDLLWTSIDPVCGGIKEFNSHETIASPGSPGNYPRNRDCKWHLKVPSDKRIKLVFFSLKIEKHADCNHDYLEITDAVSGSRLEIFCNSSNPSPFTVPSNEIFVHFHSDNEGTDFGFQIHASTVERIPGCGGTYTERSGQIISPIGFQGHVSCEYIVRYPLGLRVQLDVLEFKMSDEDCIEIFDVTSSGEKASTGKWCGNVHVPIFKSTSNAVQINYYSNGGTFKIAYGTICEYTFENPTGTITSPNYPSLYPSNEVCIYEIIGEAHQVVSLEFEDMDIESHEGIAFCWFDYIIISDGTNQTAGGPYCGKIIPPRIVTNTSLLRLTMHSDSTNAGKGFKANYALIDTSKSCGGLLRRSSGIIKLPTGQESGNYKDDLTCSWTIMAPEGFSIQLTWESFRLEHSSDCLYDYLEIFDTDQVTSEVTPSHRFCGTTMPPALVSHSNLVTLKFTSDSSDTDDGFVVRYSFVDFSKLCGGNVFSSTGVLKSLNWPNEYRNNLNCSWTISVKPGHQINLLIKSFELEESENCTNDWLEIRNGGSDSSPLIGKYCGQTIPRSIPSFTHQIHLTFKTNSEKVSGGFHLEWVTVSYGCGGILTADHGSIASPFYPQNYANDVQCEWSISVNKGSTISMVFEDLSLESLLSCSFDFIDIFDGSTPEKRKIGRYCEKTSNPITLETTGSNALIRFQSDSSNSDRGFYINYFTNCNRILNSTFGSIESPNFGDNNPSTVNCSWTIEAPRGSRIALDFAIVGKKDNSPKLDFIYVIHENLTVTRLAEAERIESQSRRVQIILNSTSIYFSMEYAMKGCIGNFHRPTGEFNSPGYPNPCPVNTECRWQIETEIGKAIELVFTEIDVELSVNCTAEHIEVWNTAQMSHSIGRFCGKRNNITITSSGHSMYIQFETTSFIRGRGLKATYKTVDSKCGGNLILHEGNIHSPNYPHNYDSNLHCVWYIEVSQHSTMTLTVEELDLEESYHCGMDSVKIYQGANEEDPWKTLCGADLPVENKFQTESNSATIVFDTDEDTEFKGFKISFKENCGKRVVVNETGRIRFEKSTQKECLWIFVAEDETKHVTLTTTHVQINPWFTLLTITESCNGVMIYDGEFTNTSSIHPKQKFCNTHPPALTSLGHALTMKISTDYIEELDVYYSIMDNNCGGSFDSLHGTFATPFYPMSYPVNIECIWEIKASVGNWISLKIQQMDIEESEDCNADYLEVREGASDGRLIGVFCGNEVPSSLLGYKSLWIKFRSDNDMVRKGFKAYYSYAFNNEINGTEGVIESPRYPRFLLRLADYSWRISVPRGNLILLAVDYMYETIPNKNEIKIFNGYDDQAELIQPNESNLIRSDTNYLYIKGNLGLFRVHWYSVSKEFMASNKTAIEETPSACANNIISVSSSLSTVIQSPGYPEGYESNLNCSWTLVPIDIGSHALVKFQKIDLEDQADCMADSVNIYSSSDMTNWKHLQTICKLKSNTDLQIAGDKFLKVVFLTDYGVNKTGFSAMASSVCGSVLTEPTGVIDASKYNSFFDVLHFECVWQIKVKTGRRIKITFLESKLDSRNEPNAPCQTYILLKNGFSEHSPNLGNGKYCDSNITDIPITSSNEAYVKLNFGRASANPMGIKFKYEEVMNECMQNIELNENQTSVIVHSENYPNIPHPHTMCVWNIRAPVHRLLAINFVEPIDLKRTEFCDAEYIEIYDGLSELSPVIGRFCDKSTPNTQYSSGNNLRITFFTDIAEPSVGFKANISLGVCGGTYRQENGTISSPKLMSYYVTDKYFSCEYTISVPFSFSVNLTLDNLNLPWTENCTEGNHLIITPIYDEDESTAAEPIVLCGENKAENYIFDTNSVRISYRIVSKEFNTDAFSFSYSSLGHRCYDLIEAESGILKSPGYSRSLQVPIRCKWKLKVPKGRRIKLEFLEFQIESIHVNSTNHHNNNNYRFPGWLSVNNDFDAKSNIARFSSRSFPPPFVYSTDNIMSLVSIEVPRPRKEGFKVRFSSDEDSIYCNENFNKIRGDIQLKVSSNTTLFCRYDIDVDQNETFALSVSDIQVNTAIMREYFNCIRNSPLTVQDMSESQKMHWFCGNRNDSTLRLPYPIMFDISSNIYNNLTALDLTFARHSCGGVFTIANQFELHEPVASSANYGAMDCAWRVLPNPDDLDQFEVSLSVDFKLKCDEEYLILYSDSKVNSPHLGRFCNQATATNLVSIKSLFIEYHTSNYNIGSKFNLTAIPSTGCGGELKYPFRLIDFRKQYQNNVECVWTIRVNKEYHVGVEFTGRFFIESSPNCTKDYLLIQEQSGNDTDDEWRDVQRICGRAPPAFVNTTTNTMRLIFRSDESGLGDGFTANFKRNCGGTFYASKDLQLLSSPNYPLQYDSNLHCNYTIHPSKEDTNFLLQFKDFFLESSPMDGCFYDKLTVYVDSEEPHVLCGSKDKLEFRSNKPISLVFESDRSFNRKGFQLQFGEQVCGGKITSNTVISTPKLKSNNQYPPNAVCVWNITAPPDSKIVVKFERFEFEGSYACNYDYVEVFSGKLPVEEERLAKLCGNLTGGLPHLSIKSNMATIQSVSDSTEPSIGFVAVITFVKNCDRNITLKDLSETYTFDTFANGYENNLNCEILFTTDPGRQLVLEFKSFHTEESSDCDQDYVSVRDGGGPFADEIGKFCGHLVPNSLMSSRSSMFLNFVTDSSDTSSGFLATIRAIPLACGAHELFIQPNKSVVISIGGDANYLPNLNCFWRVRSDSNIRLDFEKIDIQEPDAHGTCTTDYLKVYNKQYSVIETVLGSDTVFNGNMGQPNTNLYENTDSEHVFCGQGAPEGYFTNNQEVIIKFFSDSTIEKSGFKITATTSIGCFKNYTSTQGRIFMETSADCNIYINAPKDYSITIYFNYLLLFFGMDNECTSEYIEIFDEQNNSKPEKSLQKLCGSVDPSNSVFSNSSKLRLKISQSGIFNNYDMTFLASDKGPGCGGDLYNYAGVITSPYYPENARNNSDCQWNIRVPNNMAVSLEFKVFDLGSKVTCRSDYLEILERKLSNNQEFELMRKFCGEDIPTVYIGRQNTLSIRFRKTVNFDGTGWVIRFYGVRQRFSLL